MGSSGGPRCGRSSPVSTLLCEIKRSGRPLLTPPMWKQSILLLITLVGLAEQQSVVLLSGQDLPPGTHQAVLAAHQEKVQLAADARAQADVAAEQAALAQSQAAEKRRLAEQKEVASKEYSEKAAAAVKAAVDKEASQKAAAAAEAQLAADAATAGKLVDVERAATKASGQAEQREASAKLDEKKAEERLQYIEKRVAGQSAANQAKKADALLEADAQHAQKETAEKSATMAATRRKQQEEQAQAERIEKEASRKMDQKIQMVNDKEAKVNREYIAIDERERILQQLKNTADKKIELAHSSQKRVSEYAADTKKAMDAKHMQIEREIALFENQTEHVNRTLRAKEDAVDQTERKVAHETAQNLKKKTELHQMAAQILVSAKGLLKQQKHIDDEKMHVSTMANELEVETLRERAQKKEKGYQLQAREKELRQRELHIAAAEEKANKVEQRALDSLKSADQKKQEIKHAGEVAKQLVADLDREEEEKNGPQLVTKEEPREENSDDEPVESFNATDTAPSDHNSTGMSPVEVDAILKNSTKVIEKNTYVPQKKKEEIQRQREELGNATILVKSLVADLKAQDGQSSNQTTNETRSQLALDVVWDLM